MKKITTYYLFITFDDVDSDIKGPFEDEEKRDYAAIALRRADPDQRHGIFKLNVSIDGFARLTVEAENYTGGFFIDAL